MPRREVKTKQPGVYKRHRTTCKATTGSCGCPFVATVYSAREKKLIRKQFDRFGEAVSWRQDAAGAVRVGKLQAPTRETVQEAADALLAGMRDGSIATRSGRPYKPSAIRSYESSLRLYVLKRFGTRRLSEITRLDVQAFADQLTADGASASAVQNRLDPLRVIYRRAIRRGLVAVDPTKDLELRRPRGRRERIATPAEAAALLLALPATERPLWATAFYCGLRLGELRALRWRDVDQDAGVIRVRRAWDDEEGEIDVKSDAGERDVPMPAVLRPLLKRHRLSTGRGDDDLCFGRTAGAVFVKSTVNNRAKAAWKKAKLAGITLHEARHTCASVFIAAGANPKVIQTIMGHATIQMTFDQYGHLMPGGLGEAVAAVDAYLMRSATAGIAQA